MAIGEKLQSCLDVGKDLHFSLPEDLTRLTKLQEINFVASDFPFGSILT